MNIFPESKKHSHTISQVPSFGLSQLSTAMPSQESNVMPSDLYEISNLTQYLIRTTENRTVDPAKLLEGLHLAQQNGRIPFLAVKDDQGKILGFLLAAGSELSEARNGMLLKITTQVTHPGCQGQGIGRHLYDAVVTQAQANGFIGVIADCCPQNQEGQAFWRSMGHEWNGYLPMTRYFL